MSSLSDDGKPLSLALTFKHEQNVYLFPIPKMLLRRIVRTLQFKASVSSSLWKKGCQVTVHPIQVDATENNGIDGIQFTLTNNEISQSYELTREFFAPWVTSVFQHLVVTGQLPNEANCSWDLAVLPNVDGVPKSCVINAPFSLLPILTQAGIRPDNDVTPLHSGFDEGQHCIPTFVSQKALSEAVGYCQSDMSVERGGVFLGSLYQDEKGAYVDLKHFAPAWGAEATSTSMRFDKTAWESINRCRATLVNLDVAGWLHSHPFRIQTENEDGGVPMLSPSTNDIEVQSLYFPDNYLPCFIIDPLADDLENATAVWKWSHDGMVMQQNTVLMYGGNDE
jgi:hypothetical protein